MNLPHGIDGRRLARTVARTGLQATAAAGALIGGFDAYTSAAGRNFAVNDYAGWKHAAAAVVVGVAGALAAAIHGAALDPSRIPSLANPPFTVVNDATPGLSHDYPIAESGGDLGTTNEHSDPGSSSPIKA